LAFGGGIDVVSQQGGAESQRGRKSPNGAAIASFQSIHKGASIMTVQRPVVLVVEDNKDIRDLLALFLLEKGCHILEASDGRQGVQLARESHPDLVLMDLNLPHLSGLQATIMLKNHADTEGISVVALSALCTDASWREKAIQVGCENCITKPIDFAELTRVLSPYLKEDVDSRLDDYTERIRLPNYQRKQ
jgi:CheY-like chemotaxis protein